MLLLVLVCALLDVGQAAEEHAPEAVLAVVEVGVLAVVRANVAAIAPTLARALATLIIAWEDARLPVLKDVTILVTTTVRALAKTIA